MPDPSTTPPGHCGDPAPHEVHGWHPTDGRLITACPGTTTADLDRLTGAVRTAAKIDTALRAQLVDAAVARGWHDVAARMGRWAAAGYTGSWQDTRYDPPTAPGPLDDLPAFERAARALHNKRWGADAQGMWGYAEWRDEAHGLATAAITAWQGNHGCIPADVHHDSLARADAAEERLGQLAGDSTAIDRLHDALDIRGLDCNRAEVVECLLDHIDRLDTALIEAAHDVDEGLIGEQESRRDGLRAATDTLAGRVIDEDSDDRWTIRDLERVTIEMAGRYADWIATGIYDGLARHGETTRTEVAYNARYWYGGHWKVVDDISSSAPLDVAELAKDGWPTDRIHAVHRVVETYADGGSYYGPWLPPAPDIEAAAVVEEVAGVKLTDGQRDLVNRAYAAAPSTVEG